MTFPESIAMAVPSSSAAVGVPYMRPSSPLPLALNACINHECPTRQSDGPKFMTDDRYEQGDTCIHCGCVQVSGGRIMDNGWNGYRDQAEDVERAAEAVSKENETNRAASTPIHALRAAGGRKRKTGVPLKHEARARRHEYASQQENLKNAQARLRNEAASLVAHLHPMQVPGVRTDRQLAELKEYVEDTVKRVKRELVELTDPIDQASAVYEAHKSVTGSAPSEFEFIIDAFEDDEGKKLGTPDLLVPDLQHRLNCFVSREASKTRAVQLEHRKAKKEQLEVLQTNVHTMEGVQVSMRKKDVDHALAELQTRKMLYPAGFSLGAAASSSAVSGGEVCSVSSSRDMSAAEKEELLISKVKGDKSIGPLRDRVHDFFSFVYKMVVYGVFTLAFDFGENPVYQQWFDRTLAYVVHYKTYLKGHTNQQMRNVELHIAHALILASWHSPMPLDWGLMASILLRYLEDQAHAERREKWKTLYAEFNADCEAAVNNGDDLSKVVTVQERMRLRCPDIQPSLPRRATLDESLLSMARALEIRGDCPALITAFANSYLKQLHQESYQSELDNQLRVCIKEYHRRIKFIGPSFDHLSAQIGKYRVRNSSVSPTRVCSPCTPPPPAAAAAAAVSSSSSSSHSPSTSPLPVDYPATGLIWSFSASVIAITCVRKVLGDQQLKFDPIYASEYTASSSSSSSSSSSAASAADSTPPTKSKVTVKKVKPVWAQTRPRPMITKQGQPSMVIKAERFAEVAGVAAKDITACMKTFDTAVFGVHYNQWRPELVKEEEEDEDAAAAAAAGGAGAASPSWD